MKHKEKIDFRPEIGISKNRPPDTQIPIAMEYINSGIFKSIDLYGSELEREPETYKQLFDYAGKRGLKLKAHAGEFGDAEFVKRTLLVLNLHEIQHGVNASSSIPIMNIFKKNGIRLNVCPTSNVMLSVAENLKTHPVRKLVDHGVRISINTDDKTIFGNSVSDEYLALYNAETLSADELDLIRRDSLVDRI